MARAVFTRVRRGRGGDDADVELRRPNHRRCRPCVHRRYAQDEAQSGLRGEDRSLRCAAAGRCVATGERGEYLLSTPPIRELRDCAGID